MARTQHVSGGARWHDRRTSIAAVAVLFALLPALSGCMWQDASGTSLGPSLSGTVTGWPITGTYQAVITPTGPTGQCTPVLISVTLTDAAGATLNKDETGRLCQRDVYLYDFSGLYRITGGTGAYAGATGSGISTMTVVVAPRAGPFTTREIGTFQVPGTASAAGPRKRTFRMHGTVRHVRLRPIGG